MEIFAAQVIQDFNPKEEEFILSLFDSKKSQQIREIKDPLVKNQRLTSALLLQYIIKGKPFIDSDEISFNVNDFGKPSLNNHPTFHFNLSYSQDLIVCATDDEQIGIDIEKKMHDFSRLPLDIFSNLEKKYFESLATTEKINFFFKTWTRKESFLKAEGVGLNLPLASIDTTRDIIYNCKNEKWCFHQFLIEDFFISLCSKKKKFFKQIKFIDRKTLLHLVEKRA